MTGEQARRQLRSIKPEDDAQAEGLARRIAQESRDPLEVLGQIWLANDARAESAQSLLKAVSELSIQPWMTIGWRATGTRRAAALRYAVQAYGTFEEQVVTRLKRMLSDKTQVPLPQPQRPVEERELPRRVCDEAYLLLRVLLKCDETIMTQDLNHRAFLIQDEKQRDAEIRRYETTQSFSKLGED